MVVTPIVIINFKALFLVDIVEPIGRDVLIPVDENENPVAEV